MSHTLCFLFGGGVSIRVKKWRYDVGPTVHFFAGSRSQVDYIALSGEREEREGGNKKMQRRKLTIRTEIFSKWEEPYFLPPSLQRP